MSHASRSYHTDYSYYDEEVKQEEKPAIDADYGDDVEVIEDERIEDDDYWTIISAYFEGKGLVRQQLESYNEFVENTLQEIVDEQRIFNLDQYSQFTDREGDERVSGGKWSPSWCAV